MDNILYMKKRLFYNIYGYVYHVWSKDHLFQITDYLLINIY